MERPLKALISEGRKDDDFISDGLYIDLLGFGENIMPLNEDLFESMIMYQ
ncbi:hypothetical protein LMG33818_002383 [Halomonadaceae bacterium LMG 33818]